MTILRNLIILIIGLILMAAPAAVAGAAAAIQLPETMIVQSKRLSLNSILQTEIVTPDITLIEFVSSRQQFELSADYFNNLLKRHNVTKIVVTGGPVQVSFKDPIVAELNQHLKTAISQYLNQSLSRNNYPLTSFKITQIDPGIKLIRQFRQAVNKDNPNPVTISSHKSTGSGFTRFIVLLEEFGQFNISASIEVTASIPILNSQIDYNSEISENLINLEVRTVNLNHYLELPLRLNNLKARKNLVSGTIITKDAIEQYFDMNKSEKVTIIVKKGSLVLRMPGQLLSDGIYHQPVEVLARNSKKITGILKPEGYVEVTN